MKRSFLEKVCRGSLGVFFAAAAILFSLMTPAYASEQVASLSEFTGTVIVQSRGDWGVKPEKGLPLYSNDKVVTRTGTAIVTFTDGAVVEIKANSNVLIEEQEKTGSVTRNLRLLLGKVLFKTGKGSGTKTNLQTPTSVCGLRGTAGVLSIGVDGKSYIQFSEGGMSFSVGDFLSGVAKDVPAELADLNPAQRAAFVAAAAADQAKNTAAAVAEGKVSDPQVALAAAKAAEAAGLEAKAAAESMANNADPSVKQQAQNAINAANQAIEAAKQAEQKAIDAGAKPEDPKTYTPAEMQGLGFDTPVTSVDMSTTVTLTTTTTTTTTTTVTTTTTTTTTTTSVKGSANVGSGGFLDSGDLSVTMNQGGNSGSINLTGTYTQSVQNPGVGGMNGTLSDGSNFGGYLGGVIGSWQGLLASVYVTPGKEVGFITGSLDGNYDPETRSLNASGVITRSPVLGLTDLTPDQLAAALADPANRALFNDLPLPVIGSITAGGTLLKGTAQAESIEGIPLLDNTLLGVWNTIPVAGYTYSNPEGKTQWTGMYANNRTGYYSIGEMTAKDDLLGHLAVGGELSFISRRYLGTVGSEYRAKYDTTTRVLDGFSAGTYTAKPLKFVSDVQAQGMTGLLGGTGSLWSATLQNPAALTFMGSIYDPNNRVLDIHAADQGWQGGFWNGLFPGGITHVADYSNQNLIVDPLHPIVNGLTNSNYINWGYVSHDYFDLTSLPQNALTIMTNESNRPTVIEYAYGGGTILGSTQTLEYGYGTGRTGPLYNTLSYATAGGGRVLLVQDTLSWNYNSNILVLNQLGVPYDVRTSSAFVGLDLSQYSVIIIASDQTQSFYNTMALPASQSKLESFLAGGGAVDNHYSWNTTIFSHNYENGNGKDTTYDGGSYYGVLGGNRVANNLQGDTFLIYIDPAGNAGIIRGEVSSRIFPDVNSFSGSGSAFPIPVKENIGILPENLKSNIVIEPLQLVSGQGSFFGQNGNESGTLAITSTDGAAYSINQQNWGVWKNTLSGTYSGNATDSWVSFVNDVNLSQEVPKINRWATVDGPKWSGQEMSGKVSGAWVNWDKAVTGVIGGELKGTFSPSTSTWQAAAVGAHLETKQFMDMLNSQAGKDALAKLNIPCVEIGRATLNGSSEVLTKVQMKDVAFFAYKTGASPRIWATSDVNGTYSGTPTPGHTVGLSSSGGLTANFKVQNWGGSTWGASVENGAGTLTRTDGGNPSVTFQGAAAGTHGNGAFQGTGAGTAK